MANAIFDQAVALASQGGFDWLANKWKMYLVDADDCGPAPGAWVITARSSNVSGGVVTMTLTFGSDHGFVVGDRIAVFGATGPGIVPWLSGGGNSLDTYRTPTVGNGKKYRCVKAGASGTSEPTWPPTDGSLVPDGTTVWMCDGGVTTSPVNGSWIVTSVPTTLTLSFVVTGFTQAPPMNAVGYVANLSKTYLSEFVPAAGRVGVSDALTGKAILANGACDCSDIYVNTPSPADPAEALLLVKTAENDADADLPDTAQRLIAFTSDVSPLPLPSNPGNQLYSVPATGMLRL